jgi:hypothetical protein
VSPEGLKSRGKTLWDGVTAEVELDAAGLSILEDACRTADVIERLSIAACGNSEWIRLAEEAEFVAPGEAKISIVVNPILGELRQQRLALKQLLAQLKLGAATKKSGEEQTKSAFAKLVESWDKQ